MSLGTLLAAISLAPAVMQPINQLSQTTQQAQAAAGSMSRIQELLDEPPGIADRPGAVALDAPRATRSCSTPSRSPTGRAVRRSTPSA